MSDFTALDIGMRATFGCKTTKAFDISPS